ncbi:MAG: Fe(3+) ABC transporter substrate-binding protein [Hyphomicrobiales bacterium]|nr:Fe(3+) ABC transporter substrate-binding protein [Hyphomicrobiales bacterium]
MKSLLSCTFICTLLAPAIFTAAPARAEGEINIYSLRQPYLINPLLEAFNKSIGIKTNVIYADKGLIERMAAEGANSPADILLAADIGFLTNAVEQGVSQSVDSAVLTANIPAAFRDPKGQWFGLTSRARVIYASKDRVKQDAITYEELADPKWKGKICTRSGQHVYNIALTASMLANIGEAKTREWLAGVRDNLAKKPAGGDRDQAKAIFAGECDIAIGNTYYIAAMTTNEKEPEQKTQADAIKVLFPNVANRGTHMNVSGMVLAKNAPNKANAVKLMEYLSSDEAQKIYAGANNEFPVKSGIAVSPVVASWGQFKQDPVALAEIAKLRKRASELVDEAKFDQGPSS